MSEINIIYRNFGYCSDYQSGVQFTFANGLTLSCMNGTHNYCENLDTKGYAVSTSANIEIACWFDRSGGNGMLEMAPCDQVMGHVTPDQLAKIMAYLRTITQTTPMVEIQDKISVITGQK